jgi:peptide/nickel transport system permease protein
MADSSSGRVAEKKRHSAPVGFLLRLVREKPWGTVCGIIALFLLFTGIFANAIAPYGMNETWVGGFLEPPSARFWLGTDTVGRDLLSRIIFGARISVIIGLAASTLATVISTVIGVVSGYMGGKLDLIVQRFVDAWMCLPGLVILIILVTMMRPSLWSIIIALGFNWGIPGSRIVRGAVVTIKGNVYVEAAQAIGCSTPRILIRHILPNVVSTVIVLFSIRVPGIILGEASLSFLGFGIPPPSPTWGGMLGGSSRTHMFMAPWLAIWPGLALAITVYSINMFGDAVRDIADPRLRGGAGRYGVGKEAKK